MKKAKDKIKLYLASKKAIRSARVRDKARNEMDYARSDFEIAKRRYEAKQGAFIANASNLTDLQIEFRNKWGD